VEAYQVLSDPERRKLYNQGLRHGEGSAEPQPAPIIVGQPSQPEPLVPESMSVLRGFQTIQPSFEAVFERFLRNFTGIGVPKGERLEGLNVEVILSPDGAARGGVAPLGVPVSVLSAAGLGAIGSFRVLTAESRGWSKRRRRCASASLRW
jgi:DnaJ-class molecular chaperone